MPSTYSTNLRFELMANGENDATWGTLANQIFNMIEDAISEVAVITHNDAADYTLTRNDGTADEARCAVLQITGTLTANRNVVCPTADKVYIVHNATSGGFAVTIKTASGSGVSVPNGARTFVYCDGTNVVSAISQLASLSLATALPIASGGTGSTSASAARTALGLVIGTDVQAYDADLAAIAALSTTSYGRGFLTQADAAAARSYIGSIGDVTGPGSATNNAIVLFDGTTGKTIKDSTYTITAFGASLIDDADAATARSTLGLVIGTNVLAYDADIAAIAALTSAADRLPYFTGSGTAALATFTSFGRSLVDDADAATARTTLGATSTGSSLFTAADAAAARTAIGASATGSSLITAADAAAGRSALSLGTSATVNTGTSGATIPLLNAANTFSGANTFGALQTFFAAGGEQLRLAASSGSAFGYFRIGDHATSTNNWLFGSEGVGSPIRIWQGVVGSATERMALDSTGMSVNGSIVWTAGNDGAGSGLDADTVDGIQASALAQLSANNVFTGTVRARPGALTTTSGTLVAADANCSGTLTGGVTLPNSVFSARDMQVFDAGTSSRTITRGSGIEMYVNGTNVASATLSANQTCGVFWRSASVAVLSGAVV